ncbi:hypothetical protein C8R45DRAFT_938084 [Mycena sanguinolenta]|nr:hypothetical protein C8R45DRAFT_938084 [Mycena sanguinolenta]
MSPGSAAREDPVSDMLSQGLTRQGQNQMNYGPSCAQLKTKTLEPCWCWDNRSPARLTTESTGSIRHGSANVDRGVNFQNKHGYRRARDGLQNGAQTLNGKVSRSAGIAVVTDAISNHQFGRQHAGADDGAQAWTVTTHISQCRIMPTNLSTRSKVPKCVHTQTIYNQLKPALPQSTPNRRIDTDQLTVNHVPWRDFFFKTLANAFDLDDPNQNLRCLCAIR